MLPLFTFTSFPCLFFPLLLFRRHTPYPPYSHPHTAFIHVPSHLFITWLLNVMGGQLLPPLDCKQSDYTKQSFCSAATERTSSWFVTLIVLGHIVSRVAFEKMCVFDPLALRLACCRARRPIGDTKQSFFWPVEPGSAPSNRQQRESKGRKIDSSVFC